MQKKIRNKIIEFMSGNWTICQQIAGKTGTRINVYTSITNLNHDYLHPLKHD